jgi:hypothetical protein
LTRTDGQRPTAEMGNVLSDDKKQQVLALGRLGWPLRRIEAATGVRRETSSGYLRAAGIAVRPPRKWGHAKAAKEAISDSGHDADSNPAKEVIPDLGGPTWRPPGRSPTASACEPYREVIEDGLGRGRNAKAIWQDLVTEHGFAARYRPTLRSFVPQARRGTPTMRHFSTFSTLRAGGVALGDGGAPTSRAPFSAGREDALPGLRGPGSSRGWPGWWVLISRGR